LLLACSFGCQEVKPSEVAKAPKAPTPVVSPSEGGDAKTDPAPKAPFRLAWTYQARPFTRGLALSNKHVAVLGDEHVAIVGLRNGQLVKRRDLCPTFPGGFTFVGESQAALVCERKLLFATLPALKETRSHRLPGAARMAAFSDAEVAISFEAGPVRLYRLKDGSPLGELPVGAVVSSLALSRDGARLAIGLDQGDVLLVDRKENTAHRLQVKLGLPVEALVFDPSGDSFFSSAGPSAAIWDVKTREERHRFEGVSSVLAASWIDGVEVASVGRDGLLLLDSGPWTATSLSGGLLGQEPPVAVVAARDGKVLCAAERDGVVACYARGRIPARAIPATGYGADTARMTGRVAGFSEPRLMVKAVGDTTPPTPSTRVRIVRYTETEVAGARSKRWIQVGTAIVVKDKDGILHLRLSGALDPIPGVSDPFAHDTPLRLLWKRGSASPTPPPVPPEPDPKDDAKP
jgi:hypothetical protein